MALFRNGSALALAVLATVMSTYCLAGVPRVVFGGRDITEMRALVQAMYMADLSEPWILPPREARGEREQAFQDAIPVLFNERFLDTLDREATIDRWGQPFRLAVIESGGELIDVVYSIGENGMDDRVSGDDVGVAMEVRGPDSIDPYVYYDGGGWYPYTDRSHLTGISNNWGSPLAFAAVLLLVSACIAAWSLVLRLVVCVPVIASLGVYAGAGYLASKGAGPYWSDMYHVAVVMGWAVIGGGIVVIVRSALGIRQIGRVRGRSQPQSAGVDESDTG